MAKKKRATPYIYKAGGIKKTKPKTSELQEIKIDTEKRKSKIEIMTVDELAEMQLKAGQNALKLFNLLLEELAKRIPKMTDDVVSSSLLSVWEKVGGAKK
jgi:hypothetical protein